MCAETISYEKKKTAKLPYNPALVIPVLLLIKEPERKVHDSLFNSSILSPFVDDLFYIIDREMSNSIKRTTTTAYYYKLRSIYARIDVYYYI